ncbi:MAG TPA: hypothetical protein VHY37_06635 [Tepidisphaeraceae bacterium]|nr:hypothetical protein [Tepidisphaeraceae bacterium]
MWFESLENRCLLSASPVSTQVKIDRLQVRADLLQFRSDIAGGTATILTDLQKLKSDGLTKDPALAPLFTTFRNDVKSMHKQLRMDNLNESAAVLQDQSVIVKELIQTIKDKHNPTALAADQQALLADRVQLQTDEIDGLDTRITTRQDAYNQLSTDLDNIVAAADADTSLTTTDLADVNTFATDRNALLTTLTADLQTIDQARNALSSALSAEAT